MPNEQVVVQKLKRVFMMGETRLPDPDERMHIQDVINQYATVYPELTTAKVKHENTVGDELQYILDFSVGTKG